MAQITPLGGTLELVILKELCILTGNSIREANTARGIVVRTKDPIIVSNGRHPFEMGIEQVLVRPDTAPHLSLKKDGGTPTITTQTGNFVSSQIPQEVGDRLFLEPHQYILMGVFPLRKKQKTEIWPTLEDINKKFDPGKMGMVVYLTSGGYEVVIGGGGLYVGYGDTPISAESYTRAIKSRLATDPSRYSRTILVQSKRQLSDLESAIRAYNLIPILMEPLPDVTGTAQLTQTSVYPPGGRNLHRHGSPVYARK